MILLPHATSVANRRGMGLPGLYSGRFLFGAVPALNEMLGILGLQAGEEVKDGAGNGSE